jgi:hypothetical protein
VRAADEFANPTGYKRIAGQLKGVGITVSATSVRKVLLEARVRPAPERAPSSWSLRVFLCIGGWLGVVGDAVSEVDA